MISFELNNYKIKKFDHDPALDLNLELDLDLNLDIDLDLDIDIDLNLDLNFSCDLDLNLDLDLDLNLDLLYFSEAYEVLGDEDKRKQFDAYGTTGNQTKYFININQPTNYVNGTLVLYSQGYI